MFILGSFLNPVSFLTKNNTLFNRDRFQGTNIPTLEQAVSQMLASGQRMFIDIKNNNIKVNWIKDY